jgi:hypothetical protein
MEGVNSKSDLADGVGQTLPSTKIRMLTRAQMYYEDHSTASCHHCRRLASIPEQYQWHRKLDLMKPHSVRLGIPELAMGIVIVAEGIWQSHYYG